MYYGIQLKPIDEYTAGLMPQVRFPRRTRDTASCLTRTPRSLTTKWQRTLSACRKRDVYKRQLHRFADGLEVIDRKIIYTDKRHAEETERRDVRGGSDESFVL